MNCNTTHYRANSSSVPGDPTLAAYYRRLGRLRDIDASKRVDEVAASIVAVVCDARKQ